MGTILLIAEDQALIRNLTLLLESEGYRVLVVRSARDAIAHVFRGIPRISSSWRWPSPKR